MKTNHVFLFVFLILGTSGCAQVGEFLSDLDATLGKGLDVISEKDKVTGAITLNIQSPEKAYEAGLKNFLKFEAESRKDNIRAYPSSHPIYRRAKNIYDRVIAVSHFRDSRDLKFAVYDADIFNAFATGGGHSAVFRGLMDACNDDELAYVIGHELAHNAAAHLEETKTYMSTRRLLGKDNREGYETVFGNVQEQEADKIGILYATLAGFNPNAGATTWSKFVTNDLSEYAYFRSHPANRERVQTNQYIAKQVSQYSIPNVKNPKFEDILNCNVLFCPAKRHAVEDGKGGGFLKALELLMVTVANNQKAKNELQKQRREIAYAAPNIEWRPGWMTFSGTVQRHENTAGLSFGLSGDRGVFYYTHNDKILKGSMKLVDEDDEGYVYRWRDDYGRGNLYLYPYTDGSMRGEMYMDDGPDYEQKLGKWIGSPSQ